MFLFTETISSISTRVSDNAEIRREVYSNYQQKYIHSYIKIDDKWVLNGEQKGYYEDGNIAYVYNYMEGLTHGLQKEYCHQLSIHSRKITETYYFYDLSCNLNEFICITNQLDPNYKPIEGVTGATGAMGYLTVGYQPHDSPARFIFPLIENQKIELAKRLIKSTSDLICYKDGQDLLSFAIKNTSNYELIGLLVSKGLKINTNRVLSKDLLFYLIDNYPTELKTSFKENWFEVYNYDNECIKKLVNNSIVKFNNSTIGYLCNLERYNFLKDLGYIFTFTDENMEALTFRHDDLIKQVLTDASSSDRSKFINFLYTSEEEYNNSDSDSDYSDINDNKSYLIKEIKKWFTSNKDTE